MWKYYFLFWTLLYKGWNISLPHRKGQSFTTTRILYVNPSWYLQILSSSSFLFWFTFACTCLAFCSLSMTSICSILSAVVYIFTLVPYIHIVNPLCTLFTYCVFLLCYFLQTELNLQYLCSCGCLDHTY